MDDLSDNPIRWVFEAVDHRGVGIAPESGQYRVRLAGSPKWLGDWRPATPLANTERGIEFEAVLLRYELPELGTTEAEFEIEFRAKDNLDTEATAQRCWQNIPLAAPLWVGDAQPATGPDSMLDTVGLEPGKWLSPLINGVPLSMAPALMEFEIRNGTDEEVYVTLTYAQPIAIYTKEWILTSAYLYTSFQEIACLFDGTCPGQWPIDRPTIEPGPMQGSIADLVGGIRVQDVTGTITELEPCAECVANTYRVLPRVSPAQPRILRIYVVVNSLSELAPGIETNPPETYEDVMIDPTYIPVTVTGRRYVDQDVVKCEQGNLMTGLCRERSFHARYRALKTASVTTSELGVDGSTSATATIPPRRPAPYENTLGQPIRLPSFDWVTFEPFLPVPVP